MKKSLFVAVLLLGAMIAQARPYNHSIGVNVGSLYGISYKGYVRSQEHLVVQTDINFQLGITRGVSTSAANSQQSVSTQYSGNWQFPYFSATANPNLMFQTEIGHLGGATVNFFVGGGIELGAVWGWSNTLNNPFLAVGDQKPWCKINEHLIVGTEFALTSVPMVIGIDFRPGVAEGLRVTNDAVIGNAFFDWGLALSLRYAL